MRYVFQFDAASLRPLSRMILDKHTAPSYEAEGERGVSGFWLELWDGTGRVVYQRALDDPYYRFEGPVDDTGRLRTIAPSGPRSGLFTVVIPFLPGATNLVVMASRPPDAPAAPILNITIESPA